MRFRMRYLAVERAARVIVPTEAVAEDVVEHLGIDRERHRRHPRGAGAGAARRAAPSEIAAVRERYGLPDDYLLWVGGLRDARPAQARRRAGRTPRELPLVLVGATKPWAHELPGVTLTGPRLRRRPRRDLHRRARARLPVRRRGLRAADGRGAGLRHAGRRVATSRSLREVLGDRATFVDARRPRGPARRRRGRDAARRRAPPAWTWADAARATWDVWRRVPPLRGDPEASALAPRSTPRPRPSTSVDAPAPWRPST